MDETHMFSWGLATRSTLAACFLNWERIWFDARSMANVLNDCSGGCVLRLRWILFANVTMVFSSLPIKLIWARQREAFCVYMRWVFCRLLSLSKLRFYLIITVELHSLMRRIPNSGRFSVRFIWSLAYFKNGLWLTQS